MHVNSELFIKMAKKSTAKCFISFTNNEIMLHQLISEESISTNSLNEA